MKTALFRGPSLLLAAALAFTLLTHAPAARAALTAEPPRAQTATALVGKWRFKREGWFGFRTFNADGTFTASGVPGTGKWVVAGDNVRITYAGGGVEEMLGPLDPKGTKVKVQRGVIIDAVREAP